LGKEFFGFHAFLGRLRKPFQTRVLTNVEILPLPLLIRGLINFTELFGLGVGGALNSSKLGS